MSFNVNYIGSRKNIRALVKANQYIPPSLKTFIIQTIDAGKEKDSRFKNTGIKLTTYGHYDADSASSSIGKLEIEVVDIAPEAPDEALQDAPEPAAEATAETAGTAEASAAPAAEEKTDENPA